VKPWFEFQQKGHGRGGTYRGGCLGSISTKSQGNSGRSLGRIEATRGKDRMAHDKGKQWYRARWPKLRRGGHNFAPKGRHKQESKGPRHERTWWGETEGGKKETPRGTRGKGEEQNRGKKESGPRSKTLYSRKRGVDLRPEEKRREWQTKERTRKQKQLRRAVRLPGGKGKRITKFPWDIT